MAQLHVGFDFPVPEFIPNLHLQPFGEILATLDQRAPMWPPAGPDPMAVTDAEALGRYIHQRLDAPGLEGVPWTEDELESLWVMMLATADVNPANNANFESLASGSVHALMGNTNAPIEAPSISTSSVATPTTTATPHISNPPTTCTLPATLDSPSTVLTHPDTIPPTTPSPQVTMIRTAKPPSTTPLTFTYAGVKSQHVSPDLRAEYIYDRKSLFSTLRAAKQASSHDATLPSRCTEWCVYHKDLYEAITVSTDSTDESTSLRAQWPSVCQHAISDRDFELLCGEVLNQALRAHIGWDYVRWWSLDDEEEPGFKSFGDRLAWVKGKMARDRRTLHLAMHSVWFLPKIESFGDCRLFWKMTRNGPERVPSRVRA